jgi:methyl-accepting chemotaxis protein
MTRQVTGAEAGGDLVVKSTENISSIAKENLAAVEQMTKSSEELVNMAKILLDGVASFKVEEDFWAFNVLSIEKDEWS